MMGRLIKNHWARLLTLTAAACHTLATMEAFFCPKLFFDFSTKILDQAVRPYPILQSINMVFALFTIALDWPLVWIAGTPLHRSMEFRIILWLPLVTLSSVLLYQGTNVALYYLVATAVYLWAYTEGEVICVEPWTLPKCSSARGKSDKV